MQAGGYTQKKATAGAYSTEWINIIKTYGKERNNDF